MKSVVRLVTGLLVLALAVGGTRLALAQPDNARPGVAPGRIQLVGADMAGICKPGDIERAHKLADACEGKLQCSFTPETGDGAAETCARESMALWDCGDGKTRYAALGPQNAGQSREIKLECPPQAVVATQAPAQAPPAAAPAPKPVDTAAVTPPGKGQPETVKVDEQKAAPKIAVRQVATAPGAIDMSAAGVNQERVRAICEQFYDPTRGEDPRVSLNQLHANILNAPGHAPGAVGDQRSCGAKTDVPASALPDLQ